METEARFRCESTLDKLLETKAEFMFKWKWRRIWCREKPDASLCGKSFPVICIRSWISRKSREPKNWDLWRRTRWYGDYPCQLQREQPFILDKVTQRLWQFFQNLQFDEIMNLSSITQRSVLDKAEEMKNATDLPSTSNQVDDGKNSCVRRLSVMLGRNKGTNISNRKMDRAAEGSSFNSFYSRILWNRWRANWVRVECIFPGLTS